MVDCDGLENRYGLTPIGGSNPSPSARVERQDVMGWLKRPDRRRLAIGRFGLVNDFGIGFFGIGSALDRRREQNRSGNKVSLE